MRVILERENRKSGMCMKTERRREKSQAGKARGSVVGGIIRLYP